MQPLPIDSLIPQIKSSLQSTPNLIIEAAPGAGKTTRVPPALLDPEVTDGEVWVLEPRRLAARLSARRVAEEFGEKLGETVGYQVRFEDISSPRTRLRFLTEGVFTRRLLSNPTLKGVGAIVLDEFHERHLQTDLALALLRRLQLTTRPDLKIIIMSATLDVAPLASYLGKCQILRSEGRRFDVKISYQNEYDVRPLAEQVAGAVKKLITSQQTGDMLVFLPGAAEIKRAQSACAEVASQAQLLVLSLHGELSVGEQDVAIRPAKQRKVILATNVAETSITIDGITTVIDSGLARVAAHSPWSGLPTLTTQRVSKASAIQRAGRAGRTQAGNCIRLYSEMDYSARPDFTLPEIQRLDLTSTILELHALGIANAKELNWYESPGGPANENAEKLLRLLGAIDQELELTEMGKKMVRLPLHPRQARIFLEADRQGIPFRGALIAAILGERDLRSKSFSSSPTKMVSQVINDSDVFEQEELFRAAENVNFDSVRLLELGINAGVAYSLNQITKQLIRQSNAKQKLSSDNVKEPLDSNTKILISLLSGYLDRVAKLQASDNGLAKGLSKTVILANGILAQLSLESVVRNSEYLIALNAEEKQGTRNTSIVIRSASAINEEWLFDMVPDSIQ